MTANKEKARAERKLAAMYRELSSAHRMLAKSHDASTADDREKFRDLAQEKFDTAEAIGSDVFSSNVHVARYTRDYKPFVRALSTLLDHYQNVCKLNKINRSDIVANIRASIATARTEAGEM